MGLISYVSFFHFLRFQSIIFLFDISEYSPKIEMRIQVQDRVTKGIFTIKENSVTIFSLAILLCLFDLGHYIVIIIYEYINNRNSLVKNVTLVVQCLWDRSLPLIPAQKKIPVKPSLI